MSFKYSKQFKILDVFIFFDRLVLNENNKFSFFKDDVLVSVMPNMPIDVKFMGPNICGHKIVIFGLREKESVI